MKLLTGILAATLTSVAAAVCRKCGRHVLRRLQGRSGLRWRELERSLCWCERRLWLERQHFPPCPGRRFGGGRRLAITSSAATSCSASRPTSRALAFMTAAMASSSSLDWFGSVRGRVGFAFDRALVYGLAVSAMGRSRTPAAAAGPRRRPAGSLAPAWSTSLLRLGLPRLNISISTSARAAV